LSHFQIGEKYRDRYRVEHVVRFFDGELAVARNESGRYYLQSASLQKQAPSRAIQQYRALNHPLVLPFSEVYTEERSIVWIRPYEPIHPLREVISMREVDEDQVVEWGRQLLQLEAELAAKPMPMYLLLDSRNIGVNEQGELRVLFCGLRQITAQPQILDWGSFFYSLLSGRYLEEPIDRLPPDLPVSKPMARLIQKSLHGAGVETVLSQIEAYKRKKHGKGLLGLLFGSGKKEEKADSGHSTAENRTDLEPSSHSRPAAGSVVKSSPPEVETLPDLESSDSRERLADSPGQPPHAISQEQKSLEADAETDSMKSLREELERTGRLLLERHREELERRQQELLERQRQDFRRREQELLKQQEEEYGKRIGLPESPGEEKELQERAEREREEEELRRRELERIEWERQERERIIREHESLLQAELKKLELQRLEWEKKHQELERKEQELREKLHREFEQLARELLKRQEEEFARREQELLERQRRWLEEQTRKRLEEQRKELEQQSQRHLLNSPKGGLPGTQPLDAELQDTAAKAEDPKKETERERVQKEQRERENRDHEELARQFEEYTKQMFHPD
jgi:hypothetical protein